MENPFKNSHAYLVEDHRENDGRDGEGSVVELRNGNLLLLYSHFYHGNKDASAACIVQRISTDGGLTWSERETLFSAPAGALNNMSVSLLRLQDGRIGCIFCTKWSTEYLVPMWTYSEDEGRTWATPSPVTDEIGYFVVNNDRLIQLMDGTLVLPYAHHGKFENDEIKGQFNPAWNAECGVFFSRDAGKTWTRSPHRVRHTSALFRMPLHWEKEAFGEMEQEILEHRLGLFQEPGVVEVDNGQLMMFMRSLYGTYRCFADTPESTWRDCDVIEGFHVCCGPQTIKRLPGSEWLVMLYNDRGDVPWGTTKFQWRTPLSIALSNDEGRTWRHLDNLADESRNYCYFSLLFSQNRFLITCYESADGEEGVARRNLASLKIYSGSLYGV